MTISVGTVYQNTIFAGLALTLNGTTLTKRRQSKHGCRNPPRVPASDLGCPADPRDLLENWSDIFRCFVAPTAKMGLKRQSLGISFELEAADDTLIDPNNQEFKTIREAAQQLGLTLTEE